MANIKKIGILRTTDIAALRYADEIQFNTSEESSSICSVICTKYFGDSEHRLYEFKLPCSFIYINNEKRLKFLATQAKIDFYRCSLDWELQTIFGQLQEFDEVEFVWLPNLTPELLDYHWVAERVKIIVYRKEKRYHHVLGTFVGPLEDSMFFYKVAED